MGWRKWAKIETAAGIAIFITAWPLSTCRLVILILLGGLFAIAYRHRTNGQIRDRVRNEIQARVQRGH